MLEQKYVMEMFVFIEFFYLFFSVASLASVPEVQRDRAASERV